MDGHRPTDKRSGEQAMSTEDAPSAADTIQFDRVETTASPGGVAGQPGVICGSCRQTVRTRYFSIRATPLCEPCKAAFEASQDAARSWGTFGRAVLLGAGAAVAGAVLYYAVIAITKFEIGLVAIAIGYMVGYAVRRGSHGWGGLRYQVLALALTYYAVGLAYLPFAIQGARDANRAAVSAPAASRAPGGAPAEPGAPVSQTAPPPAPAPWGLLVAVGFLLLFCVALPVLTVIGSFPGGLISAAIIGFGMRQAWRMTVVAVVALALVTTGQGLLAIIGLVAVFRVFQRTAGAGDLQTLVTFAALVGALSWLARSVG
jgi:hypothetical protein